MDIAGYIIGSWMTLSAGHHALRAPMESLVSVDENAETPAHQINDGIDFVPTNRYILFGHHWMSIAGTSAVVSSVIGLVWGWLPSLIWMLVGVHLIGAPNDYYGLMLSVKNGCKGIGQLVSDRMGRRTGKLFSSLYLLSSLLVTAMFLRIMADSMAKYPEASIPVLLLIPMAMGFGLVIRRGFSLIPASAVFTFVIVLIGIIGADHPVALSPRTWIFIFTIYTLGAMTLPVWLLLAPRDYLNTILVAVGMLLGAAALLIMRPAIQMPAFTGIHTLRGNLWPMIMATITCGAASGVHSLIATGTTARQLSNEKDGYTVVFGGMQGETFIAGISAAMIMVTYNYDEFMALAYHNPGEAFSGAMGHVVAMLGIPEPLAMLTGTLIFSALLLTTLDSWARAGRYVLQELAGPGSALDKNVWLSSFAYLGIALLIMLTVPYMDLWSGLAVGSLTLLAVPLALMVLDRVENGRPWEMKFALLVAVPLSVVFPSAVAALVYQTGEFLRNSNWVAMGMNLYMSGSMLCLSYCFIRRLWVCQRKERVCERVVAETDHKLEP